jgi:hypothetical protein
MIYILNGILYVKAVTTGWNIVAELGEKTCGKARI